MNTVLIATATLCLGVWIGVGLMCVFQVNRPADDEEDEQWQGK